MTDHYEMAVRNESLCDALLEQGDYYEWVVTTAFYSALHWMNHTIFPLDATEDTGNPIRILNIQQYKQYERSKHPSVHRLSLHAVLKRAIKKLHPTMRRPYSRLFDECLRARYQDYEITKTEAENAREHLKTISGYCQ